MAGSSPAPNALWTKYQEPAAKLRRQGKTNGEIANILGIDRSNIWYWMGPTPRRLGGRPVHNYGMRDRVRYLRECDYTIREIADITALPRSTVGDWVRGLPCG